MLIVWENHSDKPRDLIVDLNQSQVGLILNYQRVNMILTYSKQNADLGIWPLRGTSQVFECHAATGFYFRTLPNLHTWACYAWVTKWIITIKGNSGRLLAPDILRIFEHWTELGQSNNEALIDILSSSSKSDKENVYS